MYAFLLSAAKLTNYTANLFPLFLKSLAIGSRRLARTKENSILQKLYKTGNLLEFKHPSMSGLPLKETWLAPPPATIDSARAYTVLRRIKRAYGMAFTWRGLLLRKGAYLVNTYLYFPNLCIRWLSYRWEAHLVLISKNTKQGSKCICPKTSNTLLVYLI